MLKLSFIFALFLTFSGLLVSGDQNGKQQEDECAVSLKNGTVIGAVTTTLNPNKNVCSFMAIPYATPPASTAWEGTLNATSLPNWCPQTMTPPPGVEVSEDCLYLNVHQPIQQSEDPEGFPVMIYFHGGGFIWGSSLTFTPTKLLAKGEVILVVVHYRLGLLGFFSTGDTLVPGNNALKDQSHSIRWVSENIASFGGNPNKLTIFGESAGSTSVSFQLISPLNKGLLHGAIAQSGSSLASWTVDRNPGESAKITRLGCPTTTTEMMVDCLKALSWERIVQEQDVFNQESYQNVTQPLATMAPVIEPSTVVGAFISEEPATILKTGDIPNIPVMLGANKHDGSFVLANLYLYKFGPQNLDKDAEYMKQHVDVVSVFAFKSSIQNTAEILSARNRKVYLYSFEHHSNNTNWPFGPLGIPINGGVAHSDDLMYIYDMAKQFSEADETFSDVMCDMWLNFAKFGNPTPSPDARFENWEPYNSLDEPYLKLNATPTVQHGYRNSWRPNGFEWN